MKPLIIFGGQDPESITAKAIAENNGYLTANATVDGKPVHNGNAYKATGYDFPGCPSQFNYEVILFECAEGAAKGYYEEDGTGEIIPLKIIAKCDHHREGDTGYGLPPEKFWKASSLGQLCTIIGVEPTEQLLLVAAGDHCPAAAYQGKCPGIDPVKFQTHRINQKVDLQNPTSEEVLDYMFHQIYQDIAAAKKALEVASEFMPGVKDLRNWGVVPQLPEAAMITGAGYICQLPEVDREGLPTGKTKLTAGGNLSPDQVSQIMQWMKPFGTPYGVPDRGFCGVVVDNVIKVAHFQKPQKAAEFMNNVNVIAVSEFGTSSAGSISVYFR